MASLMVNLKSLLQKSSWNIKGDLLKKRLVLIRSAQITFDHLSCQIGILGNNI